MSEFNKICLGAALGVLMAAAFPVISKAEDPKETPIQGTIRLPDQGNQKAAQAALAKISIQQAINAAASKQAGTVHRVELQNEDGFLVYNVELVSADNKLHEVKVDAGNGNILRVDSNSSEQENENEGDEKGEQND
ncbi:MAG TPA: PepSY domain-containing protein [Chthoniobacterales bacterium]|nr:PepSY domain-containing protein [Chthoniobacterales bacterium]